MDRKILGINGCSFAVVGAILISGCATGKHSRNTSCTTADCRVTADACVTEIADCASPTIPPCDDCCELDDSCGPDDCVDLSCTDDACVEDPCVDDPCVDDCTEACAPEMPMEKVQPMKAEPKPEPKPVVQATVQPEPKKIPSIGHGEDYQWLSGTIQKLSVPGGPYKLRYLPLDQEDQYGGSVVLAPDYRLDQFQDGDKVHIKGKVIAHYSSLYISGPLYRMTSIQKIDKDKIAAQPKQPLLMVK